MTLIQRFAGWLIHNPAYKMTAFTLSLFAWLYVQGHEVVGERQNIDVSWELPDGLVTIQPPPSTISATVNGTLSAVRMTGKRGLHIYVDLRKSRVGVVIVDLSAEQVDGLTNSVSLSDLSSTTVKLTLDEIAQRKVRVTPVTVGDVAPGFSIDQISISPSVVEVSGPNLIIGNLMNVDTYPIDVSGLQINQTVRANLELGWGVSHDGSEITATVSVTSIQEQRRIANVPVSVLDPKGRWVSSVRSVAVTLEGPSVSFDRLNTQPIQMVVHVPESIEQGAFSATLDGSDGRLQLINAPKGLRAVRVEPGIIPVTHR